jgi:hypothetical protein
MNRLKPALTGLAIAVVMCLAVTQLSARRGLDVLAAILVAAAAIYAGSALSGETGRVRVLETVQFLIFFATALAGLWYSPALMAAGYVAHAIWDFFHHPHRVGARAGAFYPPFCLVADVVFAVFILYWF